jgi:molybdenum cofactor biosynthesis enzyme MoaA
VTALSNLARAYDKYERSYDKGQIPESTFPDRFFLLRERELEIGIEKATRLLRKNDLLGDRLVVLHTRVRSADLRPNTRTGLGRFVERASVSLDGVSFVDDAGKLKPVVLEHAMALSHRIACRRLARFDDLVPRSVSILPVARACQARCPFCFSEASVSADVAADVPDWTRISEVLSAARLRGAERAVITGGGEPTLIGTDALERLVSLARAEFSKIVLITNGAIWGGLTPDVCEQRVARLAAAGLSVLALSRHHFDPVRNAQLMGTDTGSEQVAAAVARLRMTSSGLRLRIICVLQRGGIDDEASLARYLDMAATMEVDEICFKELYVSTSVDSEYHDRDANDWSRRNQVPLRLIVDFARSASWSIAERLPWGAPVYEGTWRGRGVRVAAYTEPSLSWELVNGVCRSWNLMADGRCLASLEDKQSEVMTRGLLKLPTLP